MKYARPAPAAFRVLPIPRGFRACHPWRPGFLLSLSALGKRSPARGAGRQTPRVSAHLCPGRIVRVGNRSSVVGSGLSQRWRGRPQEDGERQTHQLPEEEDEPECGRPSDRCLPGAAAVSIHRGHRRRERIPVPEDATAGLCARRPRRSVHSHRACSNDVRAPDSPHCELAAIYLVHRGVFHVVHRWKRVVDPALGSAEPLPIGGEDRIPAFEGPQSAGCLSAEDLVVQVRPAAAPALLPQRGDLLPGLRPASGLAATLYVSCWITNPNEPARMRSPRPCVYWSGSSALIRADSIWSWPMRSTPPRPYSTSSWRAANRC